MDELHRAVRELEKIAKRLYYTNTGININGDAHWHVVRARQEIKLAKSHILSAIRALERS